METKDIISSGLLELYAAGIASEKETKEVEQWITEYPEVAAELDQITASLETYVNTFTIAPEENVKAKVFSRINDTESTKVVPISSASDNMQATNRSVNFWKLAAAASVALLIGSIAVNVVTYNKYNEADRNLVAARQTLSTLEEKDKAIAAGISVVQSKYSVPVSLNGLEASPNAAAKVFWMKNTGEVFIDPSNLPPAPVGKQYQLWGIVDGKPVDGGMILNTKQGDIFRMQKMNSFGKAEAFAITLEPEKGNLTPQGPMFVMGKM